MLISVNWLRDFVDVPEDFDPPSLAERFTMICAEVEGVERLSVGAEGLIAAGVRQVEPVGDRQGLYQVRLDVGNSQSVDTVSAASGLRPGTSVVFAPPGARVDAYGEIQNTTVAGLPSTGMILPGDALGIALAVREAVFLDPDSPEGRPGAALHPAWFDDWVIEVDNKSITHRPDLWGHYGIAREIAAIFGKPLKPYPVTPHEELAGLDAPELPIEIDDPELCPRYSALVMRNLDFRAAPLWMQLRLGHVGLRPIDCMVDLTNYIMIELGQPMHAFDGDKVDRIEVGVAESGSKFTTLDDVTRTLPDEALMIMSHRRPVALAGIMGGADTEIGADTKSVLLESANFDAATIRRCAVALGHRTDASARFEKSLDPANTVLGIQRFVYLARNVWPQLDFASRLSDGYPRPAEPIDVDVDPAFVNRFMGEPVSRQRIEEILTPLGFDVAQANGKLRVRVPSYRATKDISIEADVIEEIARYVGYDNIEPSLPEVTVRSFAPNALHQFEQATLRQWTRALGASELHGYLWYDSDWCRKIGFDPGECVQLRNPIAAGLERLRQTLMPGLLHALEVNRHHLDTFKLVEIGSVFLPDPGGDREEHRMGLLFAQRRKGAEDQILGELRGAIETWTWQTLDRQAAYSKAEPDAGRPWEHQQKTALLTIDGTVCGKVAAVPLPLRRAIDDHLSPWSAAWAEINLDPLAALPPLVLPVEDVPAFPQKDLDFTAVVSADRAFAQVAVDVRRFDHPLLRRITYVTSFEGKALGEGRRSLTFRARIGSDERTLVEDDLVAFRESFSRHLTELGLEIRGAG